jgi:hypothetical protein
MPPFGPGTRLHVRCGPDETAVLMLTRIGGWVLHELRYSNRDRPDREFCAGGHDWRPRLPGEAAGLSNRLLEAHAVIVSDRSREAARLAADGSRPRICGRTYGPPDLEGTEITLDVPGGTAVFASAAANYYFLSGPGGAVTPAPLDSWTDLTGGFLLRDGRTPCAILGHKLRELKHLEAVATLTGTSVRELIPHGGPGRPRGRDAGPSRREAPGWRAHPR